MSFNDKYTKMMDEAASYGMKLVTAEDIRMAGGSIRPAEKNSAVTDNRFGTPRRTWQLKKPAAIIIAAAVVILAGTTVFAAAGGYFTRAFQSIFRADIRIEQHMEKLGMVSVYDETYAVTAGGVTAQPTTLVTDGRTFYLGFKFSGYDTGEEIRPEFTDQPEIDVSDCNGIFGSMGFYNNVMDTEDDGCSIDYDHTLSFGSYYDSERNLEYLFVITPETDGLCWGKNIHVEFKNLSTYNMDWKNDDADKLPEGVYWAENVVEGPWSFDISIPEESEAMKSAVRKAEPLDHSELWEGVSITGLEITPFGIYVTQTRPADVYAEGEPDHPKWDNLVKVNRFSLRSGEIIDYIPGRIIDPGIIKDINAIFVQEAPAKGSIPAHPDEIRVEIR